MSSCPTMRRKLVTFGLLDPNTGAIVEDRKEWVTEPCGAPLFGKDREAGICRSCARGWRHEHNFPVSDLEANT